MAAACARRTAAGDAFERGDGLCQMIFFERRLLRHPVFPHVIGDLVAALDNRTQRLRVEFADPPRCEDRRLNAVRIEQLDEPPDPDASAEFALGELHRRFMEQPAQQHRVEIAGEVDRNADPFWPGEVRDELVSCGVSVRRAPQFRERLVEVCRRHCAHSDLWELRLHRFGRPSSAKGRGSGARHCAALD